MKVNREKFLAAALLLSTITGCDKLGLKGKETAKAAPETVASAQLANDPSVAPTAPAAEADSMKAPTATGGTTTKNARAKVGVAPPVVGPNNEVVAPNNEGVIAPGREVIAPGNEVIPVVAPANENIPVAPGTVVAPTGPGGNPMHIPKGRVRGQK